MIAPMELWWDSCEWKRKPYFFFFKRTELISEFDLMRLSCSHDIGNWQSRYSFQKWCSLSRILRADIVSRQYHSEFRTVDTWRTSHSGWLRITEKWTGGERNGMHRVGVCRCVFVSEEILTDEHFLLKARIFASFVVFFWKIRFR